MVVGDKSEFQKEFGLDNECSCSEETFNELDALQGLIPRQYFWYLCCKLEGVRQYVIINNREKIFRIQMLSASMIRE